MDYVLERAASFAPITLQLTSRPSRVAANALYRKLGFLPKETNFYTMKIEEKKI
jgi:ribosomal protein S18 acetylase RimI-like enzyme